MAFWVGSYPDGALRAGKAGSRSTRLDPEPWVDALGQVSDAQEVASMFGEFVVTKSAAPGVRLLWLVRVDATDCEHCIGTLTNYCKESKLLCNYFAKLYGGSFGLIFIECARGEKLARCC